MFAAKLFQPVLEVRAVQRLDVFGHLFEKHVVEIFEQREVDREKNDACHAGEGIDIRPLDRSVTVRPRSLAAADALPDGPGMARRRRKWRDDKLSLIRGGYIVPAFTDRTLKTAFQPFPAGAALFNAVQFKGALGIGAGAISKRTYFFPERPEKESSLLKNSVSWRVSSPP